jgi:mono/diheme cytochrome c family protein
MRNVAAIMALALLTTSVAAGFSRAVHPAQAAGSGVREKADTARGKVLFDKTLRCYACHGFGAQTGTPRLVPMARTEESFITYLRKPATPGMPAFVDVPRQDLVDVYAYIKSLRADAPAADSIPLLKDLIERSK